MQCTMYTVYTPIQNTLHLVDHGTGGPLRCNRCKTYMNPFVRFVDGGRQYICPICQCSNEGEDACIHVHVIQCTLTHTHTHTHTHIMHIHIHTQMHPHTLIHTHMHAQKHMHTRLLLYTCTPIHSHVHTHTSAEDDTCSITLSLFLSTPGVFLSSGSQGYAYRHCISTRADLWQCGVQGHCRLLQGTMYMYMYIDLFCME